MADEPTLLRAVLADPDADVPRLEYAQWCAGQRDPAWVARGEVIRAQLDLDRADPQAVATGQLFGLQHRVRELVDAHGDAWAGPIATWADEVRFVRGFVEWIRLPASEFLARGSEIFERAPVRHLDLSAVRDVDEALFETELLAGVRSLAMDRCSLYDIHVQLLAASPHVTTLRWLSVANNKLTLAAAEALAASKNLPSLRFLEFRGNEVDPVEQLGLDSGVVVASWMPPEGVALEARHGHLPWLHREPTPARFER